MDKPATNSGDSDPGKVKLGSLSNDTELIAVAGPVLIDEVAGSRGEEGPVSISAPDLLVAGTEPFVRQGPGRGRFESLIGDDERVRIFDTASDPWRMICSLEIRGTNGSSFVGTGFFVGPRTLLTAGHCVHDAAMGGWADEIVIYPGRNGTQELFARLRSKVFSTTDRWGNQRDPDFDYAAIHLGPEAEAVTKRTGWFSTAVMSDAGLVQQRINVSGYPGDKGKTNPQGSEQWFHAKQVVTVSPLRVFYDVDTMPGQSGAPAWLESPNGPRVVGVHAYGTGATMPGVFANSAPRITQPVLDVIKGWIAKQ